MFWGYSPALDLLNEYMILHSLEGKSELNILVAGSADMRHVLKTLSKYYTHNAAQNLRINFYIVELLLEFIAREMLLLLIALEPSDRIGLKEKADLWLEIFGNSMLRPTSAEYLVKKSYQYIKIVTNKNYQLRRIPCIVLDYLKYVEKDRLEVIFKFWVKNRFNMAENWDKRVRKYLDTRYDSRIGVFDWDYFMHIKDIKDGDKINAREYKQWRNTGVAFTWLEKEFSISNVTLALGINTDGDKLVSLDYLGDILISPYYCFGLDCEDSDMMKKVSEEQVKRITDVTERNVIRMFYEIEHNSKYEHNGNDRDIGGIITSMVTLKFDNPQMKIDYSTVEDDYTSLPVKHKVIFLPTNTLEDPAKLEKYHRYFDLMCISQGLLQKLNTEVLSMVKHNGPILMETRKFLLLKKEDQKKFEDDIVSVMKEANCVQLGKGDFMEESWILFQNQVDKEEVINEVETSETGDKPISEDTFEEEKTVESEVLVREKEVEEEEGEN